MSKKSTLYLVDGSSYIFRAYFGIRQNLTTSSGMPTNALYGYVNMLNRVVREEKPDFLAVAFDSKEKTFRHEFWPEYKANRDTPPEDLQAQFPYFLPVTEAYNIACLKLPGFEADDLIGTLSLWGHQQGLDVVIVSGDKDMMQLVGNHVGMLDTMKNKRIGREEVIEKFGVPPEKVIEVMGLMGDTSDNIPGVKGVGPKMAAELISQYGTIEGVYEHIDEITKKKLKENLERDKDQAFMSRKLVTIETAVDLPLAIEDLKFREPDSEVLKKLFSQFEFKSLLSDLGAPSDDAPEIPDKVERNYQTVLDAQDFDALTESLKKAETFAFDLETTSKSPVRASIVGISFSFEPGRSFYIPLAHNYIGVPEQLDKKMVLEKLKPLFEDASLKKVGQNIKYDLIVLRNEGIQLRGIYFDTMLAHYLLNPSSRGHGLDELAMEFLGVQTITYKEVAGSGAKQRGFDEVEIEAASEYAAEDSDVTWQLYEIFNTRLDADERKLLDEIEMPLVETLADMELAGILLDAKMLGGLSVSIDGMLKDFEAKIYDQAGETFNINSTKQLAVILFEKLELPAVKKTKSGYSTDVSVLEELAAQHPLPELILNYRQLAKLKSTYVDSLPQEVYSKTGRVHTSYNQTVAATGRLSSSDPNLQNIPIRTEIGREIRKAFIAPEGRLILSADYSQIELRLLAHLSGDPALTQAFERGEDIHSRTAAEIFNQDLDAVNPDLRRMAKAVNFGIVYGLSPFGLSRQLKISQREAKEFIEQYFHLYKNVKLYMETTVEQARDRGFTLTLFNRKRYLPDLNSKNRQARQAAERVAINSPVQGSAADLIKVAMIRLREHFAKSKMQAKMLMQVHDELVFECPEEEKDALGKLVKQEMEQVMKLSVPLVVDMGWGPNWNDAH
ncbi:MAG: DNA polymerase I [Candidatus Nitrohelix vancouverensis]|uniref:DNA polymerase I n=1 Tax=Candidatus Nitrohelix vancouverensis TaxID=2705534 RepID=A0A7T0C379_9BACT|nr:MAG: DNA polymerase I [Candidatus Nitrohelix vancouverensis]